MFCFYQKKKKIFLYPPLRGNQHALPLSKIPLDSVSMAALAEQGIFG